MCIKHLGEIHSIELIPGENQHVLYISMLDAADITAYRIGSSLIPLRMLNRLLRGENFNESVAETVKNIGVTYMAMQTH